jgi:FkbM family methyltransferase
MSAIHIACQSTSQLAADCAVMLRSLLAENPGEEVVVHFLHDGGIAQADRARLGELVEGLGGRFSPLRIPEELIARFPPFERYGGLTVWFRLLLPRLLEGLERVLYLDADVMIVAPLRPLWELELGGRALAAVTQPLISADRRRVVRELGLPDPRRYFNSGVLLMDLERLRAAGLMAAVERVALERRLPIPWADQDALNVALWVERVELHPRWNVMNPCFELPARHLPWPAEQVFEALGDPAIIHFIGDYKPWHYRLRHPYAPRYFEHLEQTPWRGRRREGRTARHLILKRLPPYAAWRYELGELALRRAGAAAASAGAHAAGRMLARTPRVRALAREGYRRLAPRSGRDALSEVLEALADARPELCFVQIGAGDADYEDPLRRHVESRGWRGIMVEPVPYLFERLRARYEQCGRIALVNAAVAAEDRTLPFYHLAESEDPGLPEWYDKLGSFSLQNVLHPYHAQHIPELERRVVRREVPALTLRSLLRAHPLARVDLVQVDAEGFDDEIVAQLGPAGLRPAVVLYEHKHLEPGRRRAAAARLAAGGYLVLEAGHDTLAVSDRAPGGGGGAARPHARTGPGDAAR